MRTQIRRRLARIDARRPDETSKVALTEKTGDKVPQKEETKQDENSGNIVHLKKLAGIK